MGRPVRTVLSLPTAMLPNRKPPASLIRPKPRPARKALAGFALLMTGGLAGLLLGVSLDPVSRPSATPQSPELAAEVAQRGDPGAVPAANPNSLRTAATEAAREAQSAEEARLATAIKARVEAESRLADTNRALAAAVAQRDAMRGFGRRDPEARDAGQLSQRDPYREPGLLPREQPFRRETVPPPAVALAPAPAPLRLPRPDAPAGNGGATRVVIHYRAGSATTADAAATASQLREAGFDASELRSVGAVPAQRVVRYFHTDDAPAAARLAGRLGRGWAIQDFRSFEPLPSSGLLEVWLPDR